MPIIFLFEVYFFSIKKLATAICEGLLSGRVFPVIKHIPGHGRALVDSHINLPTVDATFEELMETDFEPFRRFSDMPLAMTAHIIFSEIDENNPVTLSRRVIEKVVRGYIGYDGLLISDDLSMRALSGGIKERNKEALDAGCDMVLHCNGKMDELISVVAGAENMTDKACESWARATQLLPTADDFNVEHTLSQLNDTLFCPPLSARFSGDSGTNSDKVITSTRFDGLDSSKSSVAVSTYCIS